MLKLKKILFFILSFISGFILLTIYYYAESIFRHTEECTADWIIFNGQEQANLTLDFMYSENNKTGTVALSGTLLQKISKQQLSDEILTISGVKITTPLTFIQKI